MIPIAPNPVLFTIGQVSVRYYGLVYALGFLLTYLYLVRLSKKGRIQLSVDEIETFLIYLILGVVLGGRIGEFIFFQWDVLITNPLQIFKIWEGGMAFHGAAIGVCVSTWLFCRKYKVHFYTLTDLLMLPAAIALFFGRIANFINAELVGRVTNVWWCVNYFGETNVQGELVCRHPSQLYQAAKNLVIAGVIFFLQFEKGIYKKEQPRPGYISWMFVFLYGILRTFTNIWRQDEILYFGLLSQGQFLSVIMIIIAGIVLYTQYWSKPKKLIHKGKRRKKK